MQLSPSLQRIYSVARKEVVHIRRDPATMFFAIAIPIIELFMLGYAIDTNVRHIRTVVYDQCRSQESAIFLRQFATSEDFDIVGLVHSDEELHQAIVSGKAKVAIKIPEDYSRRLEAGQTAQVLIKVDGSESSVAGEALNVSNAIALRESLARVLQDKPLPIDARPQILFNPDTRSPNFFIPGLMVVMCQMMASMLTTTSIVREKEIGTMEQLFMTPVKAREVMIGKMTPYIGLTFLEFCVIAFLMRIVFQVPIHGSFFTLLLIALPFILTMLGIGLFISARASSREAAGQMVMGSLMPSIFLSGYVFPVDSMPWIFRQLSQVFPTTWLIDAARGVILRGAGWPELWLHCVVLWAMAIFWLVLSTLRFKKQLG
ncbi:MAG TPA: ABC transporter permease [Gemmataceae bacterium]|nr:ABC transporter permease [Gemmataceae bacterium]